MSQRAFKIGLLLSLLFHICLVVSSFVLPEWLVTKPPEKIDLAYLSPEDLQKLKDAAKEQPMKQIVQQNEKALNDELDPQAKFLSAHNQVVKKQTVADKHGEFRNRAETANQVSQKAAAESKPSENKQMQNFAKNDVRRFMPQMDYEKMVNDKLEQEKQFEMKPSSQQPTATNSAQDSKSFSAQASEASQTNDYLKDVDKGNETLLSTKEFVYYTFYNRIRQQLNQYWGGKVREKLADMFKQGRSIASTEDRITKLLIVLDKKGILVKVQVISNSGVRDLDEAAIEAFRAAAPFPNPPKGIVDADGTIKIRWDFILEASRSNLFATDTFWC